MLETVLCRKLAPMPLDKHLRWLEDELDEWAARGYIDEQQARVIRDHYQQEYSADGQANYFGNLAVVLLATLLIGGGIVLLVAYNWDSLSRSWRTFFSFAPLVIAQLLYAYVFFRQRGQAVWEESASGFLQLMLAVCLSLVSQTYHILGSPEDFLIRWLALSVPLLFLFPSAVSGILYWIGLAAWSVQADGSEQAWYWAFALVGILQLLLRCRDALAFTVVAWAFVLSLPVGWFFTLANEQALYYLWGTSLWLALLVLFGAKRKLSESGFWWRPLLVGGQLGILVLAFLLTFDLGFRAVSWHDALWEAAPKPWWSLLHAGVLAVLLGVWLWQGGVLRNRLPVWHRLTAFFPLVALGILLLEQGSSRLLPSLLANGFILAVGLQWLAGGIKRESLQLVNLGLLLLLLLILVRFFDSDLSRLFKGILFIASGILFLMANRYLSRRFSGAAA